MAETNRAAPQDINDVSDFPKGNLKDQKTGCCSVGGCEAAPALNLSESDIPKGNPTHSQKHAPGALRRVRVIVSGRVQNVGFRAFVLRRAAALSLSGWVRNIEDERSVELEAQGAASDVAELIEAVRRGPSAARVERVLIEEFEPAAKAPEWFDMR